MENYLPTLGFEVSVKTIQIDGRTVILSIWDIGSQNPEELRMRYFQGAAGFLIVFDITKPETFEALDTFYGEIRTVAPSAPVVFIANKIDLPNHRITKDQLLQKAKKFHVVASTLTSAKSGAGIEDAFYTIGKTLIQFPNPML
jgi:Ras-related protein Rab-18